MRVFSICLLLCSRACLGYDLSDVIITIVTHNNHQHITMATEKQHLWLSSNEGDPVVLVSAHLDLDGQAWTIAPLLQPLLTGYGNASWFLFVTEWTDIDLNQLQTTLKSHDKQMVLYIGHRVEDTQSTITHHFGQPKSLGYPLLQSGFILSTPALRKMAALVDHFDPSFNIDSSYEFSQFLKYLRTPSIDELFPDPSPPPPEGLVLTHDPRLCSTLAGVCATGYSLRQSCGGGVNVNDVFFAVKTCTKYHNTRLPVVQGTWAADLSEESIGYYSDSTDDEYHTTDIGVPNTARGHCGKLEAILRRFEHAHKDKKWLIVADDDTLLSVSRLLELLACYDHTQPLLLGEVYGYGAHRDGGSSYITGGGSIVLSQAAVTSFVTSDRSCPTLDYPDDMFLGSMGRILGWQVVHSPLFHQSQPESYPAVLLDHQRPISFHRHYPTDPFSVYTQYLADSGVYRDRTEL